MLALCMMRFAIAVAFVMIRVSKIFFAAPLSKQKIQNLENKKKIGFTGAKSENSRIYEKKTDELTAADLVVLSLLAEEPMHGYKIVSELEKRDAKDWASVSKPQVYYSIEKLVELNLIALAPDEDCSKGSEREKFKMKQNGF